MSNESKEEVRDKTYDVVEEKIGKVGHEGTVTDRTDFELCRNHSEESIVRNSFFSSHRQRIHRVLCKGADMSHGNANNGRLGEDGDIGEVFVEQAQGSVVVQISRNAVPT